MNAIMYLYMRSIKNKMLEWAQSPKRLAKTLGLGFIFALFVAGAASGGVVSATPAEMPFLKGIMFVLFLIPFLVGRYGGIGPFSNEHMNFIFTAPISPRTVLLSEILRRLWDMIVISLAIMTVFGFIGLTVLMEVRLVLLAGFFCFVLAVVSKLFGMFMFVAYRRAYRWIGFFWIVVLLAAGVFYFARAGWEIEAGMLGLLGSNVFAFTPLIGWAAAGAFAFIAGNVVLGVVYLGLLAVAGGYFFMVIYKSSPDFYDEALGLPDIGGAPAAERVTHTANISPDFRGVGAKVFFDKHLLEESGGWSAKTRIPWARGTRVGAVLELIGIGIFGGMAFAIIWGIYARGYVGHIEQIAMIFRTIGVPSGNILAVLIPCILVLAAYPQYDRGFMELYNPYFYMMPDSPARKLLWVSMARIVKVCAVAVLVITPAGLISGTSIAVLMAVLPAYIGSAFMILGLRLAVVRFLGVVSGGRQKLVATLPVMLFVLVGVVGMLAVFYFGPERFGLIVALLGFTGYCVAVGALAVGVSLKVLHDVDAPV
ncbi:MAG: putative ABC exporter domain-containing protein [Defluviitaleaceae bacterium]|nr:putative ABC exporter domain-containing protein [Defluviitaleaceae bacterium]